MTPRGWCPTLSSPMQSGDGLLLRIRPGLSRLDAEPARRLAAAASRHGNGVIELTNRGNLQCRGFNEASAAAFAAEMADAGLVDRRLAAMVSPLAGSDPSCAPGTLALAQAVDASLADAPALAAKFAILVDGGGQMPMGSVTADIAVRSSGDDWRIESGDAATLCGAGDAAAAVARLARAAAMHDARPARTPGCGAALFQAAGLPSRPCGASRPPPPVSVGRLPARSFGIGLPPGRLDAGLLTLLADLADGLGDGTLRITPWRSLLLTGLSDHAEPTLRQALAGHLLDPDDPRLRTASCIGGPGCANGSVPATADALRLGVLLPGSVFLHVSGCAKGCAHAGPAPLTLVGRDGGYDLVQDGRAGDAPVRQGLSIEAVAELLQALGRDATVGTRAA